MSGSGNVNDDHSSWIRRVGPLPGPVPEPLDLNGVAVLAAAASSASLVGVLLFHLAFHAPSPHCQSATFFLGGDGTRGCGCGFDENLPAGKSAGLEKTRPQVDPRVQKCTRTHTRGFRVSAGVTTDIIKIHKSVNLNCQTSHFYK